MSESKEGSGDSELREDIDDILHDLLCDAIIKKEAIDRIEGLIHSKEIIAIGWTHADDCVDLDNDHDPRKKDIANIIKRARIDLSKD